MIFAPTKPENSEGCFLAHSLLLPAGRVRKGARITADIMQRISDNGITDVLVAQLEDGDVHEDTAAQALATHLQGVGLTISIAKTGRVNVLASQDGLLTFDAPSIIAMNMIDEGITVATLTEDSWVAQGRMVATIKIIPYAVKQENVNRVIDVLADQTISVRAPTVHTAELIQTRLSSVKESTLDKTCRVTCNRLTPRQVILSHESRCNHQSEELQGQLEESLARNPDWILVVGASAISDRADIIPHAIAAVGGVIDRYGIPVDPGNLLLLAHVGNTQIIGLPGCARSQRHNGLDLILDRLACNVPITQSWLCGLSVGGLLTEIADRPSPRVDTTDEGMVGAIILAAGSSRRAGPVNKLLVSIDGTSMVRLIAQNICASNVSHVIAVTGHEHEQVEIALADTDVKTYYNPAHNSGMASSVVTGVSKLTECDAVVVCLGDMPHITTAIINQLIEAFKRHPEKSIFVPVASQQRGNPVLFTRLFFDTLLTLTGDTGAKNVIQQYPQEVHEVTIDDSSILLDYDTPEELATLT